MDNIIVLKLKVDRLAVYFLLAHITSKQDNGSPSSPSCIPIFPKGLLKLSFVIFR